MNVLLQDWETPFGMPPFAAIRESDFGPAFAAAMGQARDATARIVADPDPPTFANTIEALERCTRPFARVSAVFNNLISAHSNDALEALQRELSPKFAAFWADITMDRALFARVQAVHAACDDLSLTAEQARVVELYHRMFVRAGARLGEADARRLKAIMERLASLATSFSQNVLKDEKGWVLPLAAADLEGLPQWLLAAATQAAHERGLEQPVITLSRSLIVPFLQLSPRRDLRETAFAAWVARGSNGGAADNRGVIAETLRLREERARLLGYPNFSAFKLEPEMAKTPQAVRRLLMDVWGPARAAAEADADALTELMRAEGGNDDLRPWDWRYYAAIRQQREHDLDDAEVKPYFELEAMINAAFDVAGRLFQLEFAPLQVDLHHPDARAWEVTRSGRHLGVFIGDYFARTSKRSGAWCSTFRSQRKLDGEVRPIVINVCNFAKAPPGAKCLLTFDDARTLFHEFGHALHQLLSDVTYEFVSGTSVARDFVELPSQLYEHWLSVPEVLQRHGRHAHSGEPMPADLLRRLLAAGNFDMGFRTVEFLASALVDLDLHDGAAPADPMVAQAQTLMRLGMPEAIVMRHAAPHFLHVFGGDGYSSGYYSYLWSEVMDADAFEAFVEAGDPFHAETAARLARYVYSAGGSRDPAELFTAFRGRMPGVGALLRGRGLM